MDGPSFRIKRFMQNGSVLALAVMPAATSADDFFLLHSNGLALSAAGRENVFAACPPKNIDTRIHSAKLASKMMIRFHT
ncbi:MAG: hypothetical protein JW943_06410 [Deltaproteobacteria bacterium]|nr:hypothetical protein [Deltaproteobacteria bacterium]